MFKCGSIIFYANNIDDNYIIKIIRSLQKTIPRLNFWYKPLEISAHLL
jgi:hypothetical protein